MTVLNTRLCKSMLLTFLYSHFWPCKWQTSLHFLLTYYLLFISLNLHPSKPMFICLNFLIQCPHIKIQSKKQIIFSIFNNLIHLNVLYVTTWKGKSSFHFTPPLLVPKSQLAQIHLQYVKNVLSENNCCVQRSDKSLKGMFRQH